MYYILEQITSTTKKVIAVSSNLEEIKEKMSAECHSLNKEILDYEEDVKTIVTENMVIYGYNNTFYCYRIVEKWSTWVEIHVCLQRSRDKNHFRRGEPENRIDDGGGAILIKLKSNF